MLEVFKTGKRATVSGVLTLEQMCEDFSRITGSEGSSFRIGTYYWKRDGRNYYAHVTIKQRHAELKVEKDGTALLDACMSLHKELRFMGLL